MFSRRLQIIGLIICLAGLFASNILVIVAADYLLTSALFWLASAVTLFGAGLILHSKRRSFLWLGSFVLNITGLGVIGLIAITLLEPAERLAANTEVPPIPKKGKTIAMGLAIFAAALQPAIFLGILHLNKANVDTFTSVGLIVFFLMAAPVFVGLYLPIILSRIISKAAKLRIILAIVVFMTIMSALMSVKQ